jgi:hypothetical protein
MIRNVLQTTSNLSIIRAGFKRLREIADSGGPDLNPNERGFLGIRAMVLACVKHDKCAEEDWPANLFSVIADPDDMEKYVDAYGGKPKSIWCNSGYWRSHSAKILTKAVATCADVGVDEGLARIACNIESYAKYPKGTNIFNCGQVENDTVVVSSDQQACLADPATMLQVARYQKFCIRDYARSGLSGDSFDEICKRDAAFFICGL